VEKMEAHEKALLHRAFSVFYFLKVKAKCYCSKEQQANITARFMDKMLLHATSSVFLGS